MFIVRHATGNYLTDSGEVWVEELRRAQLFSTEDEAMEQLSIRNAIGGLFAIHVIPFNEERSRIEREAIGV